MSYIEKLLQGAEVKWKTLGEVSNVLRGKRLTRHELSQDENYPVFHGGIEPLGFYSKSNRPADTVMIINVGASAGTVGYSPVEFWSSDGCFCLEHSEFLNNKFLYYFLLGQQHFLKAKVRVAGIPTLDNFIVEKIYVAIPPLKVQNEIVRILDKFTELTAELTAELIARKKQYSFYREKLLSFEEGEVEWKTLGEIIIKSYSGSTPQAGNPKFYENGTIPWLRTQEVKFSDIDSTEMFITEFALENTATKWIPINCVIIAISGATAGRSAINKIPLTTNQHCLCLEINPQKALYRYVFYWVSFNYENFKSLGQGARGDLNSSMKKSFKIPIPPLEQQERIVSILDKFDILTTSISEGLPKEIELRKKQYEYYRDLLLTFPLSESGLSG